MSQEEVVYEQAPPVSAGIPRRNYFGGWREEQPDNLRFRLDGKDAINDLCDELRGYRKDRYGRIMDEPEAAREARRIMNDMGIYRVRTFLQAACGRITHLTKYQNEDRVLRQMHHLSRAWLYTLVRNRKEWDIRDKDIVLHAGEKLMFESMLRANEGFENNNISKAMSVHEQIDRSGVPPPGMKRPGFFSRLLGG